MKKTFLFLICFIFFLNLFMDRAVVASVISTFDTDTEGWTVSEIFNDTSIGGQWGVSWSATGGLPNGAVYTDDVGSGSTVFSAPSKFLGDKTSYLGGTISFDLRNSVANYDGGDVYWNTMLVGGGIKIVHWGPYPKIANQWVHDEISLDVGDWTYAWSGSVAEEDFLTVLGNLEGIYIHTDWGWGSDTSTLDNVVMVPEPATLSLLALGGLLLRKRK